MVVIRLSRAGAKKHPFYYMVVADSRRSRDGRFIEQVGFYNPDARGQESLLRLSRERIQYWESCGAQLSPRVKTLVQQWDENPALHQQAQAVAAE